MDSFQDCLPGHWDNSIENGSSRRWDVSRFYPRSVSWKSVYAEGLDSKETMAGQQHGTFLPR